MGAYMRALGMDVEYRHKVVPRVLLHLAVNDEGGEITKTMLKLLVGEALLDHDVVMTHCNPSTKKE